ncbi:MAG: hypothetical protein JO359_00750 [Candidatus Eremiobacteraeota bacterium]|nr:hypothetical protein [Candidatus Eremiobacteraeota bacterium]
MDERERTVPTTRDTEENDRSLRTYVSDMLALERHIREPLARQSNDSDVQRIGEAKTIVDEMFALCERHAAELESSLSAMGGHAASPVKSAWSQILGAGAAAIDSIRKTKVSKDLRDDYTALSLAAVSYSMLHTSGLALGNSAIAELGKLLFSDYASILVRLGRIIPRVVVEELRLDGESVEPGVVETATQTVEAVWR